jgi:glucan 1,3-beta-glucosidase
MCCSYAEAYRVIREAGGVGAGNGPYMSIHEGNAGVDVWTGWLSGADRIAMDIHPYFAFGNEPDPLAGFIPKPCTRWGESTANAMKNFGFTAAGEFRYAVIFT